LPLRTLRFPRTRARPTKQKPAPSGLSFCGSGFEGGGRRVLEKLADRAAMAMAPPVEIDRRGPAERAHFCAGVPTRQSFLGNAEPGGNVAVAIVAVIGV